MSLKDDLQDAFSASSDDDKIVYFEQSTLALVLKQLGAGAGRVKAWQLDLGPRFGFDWFNEQFFIDPFVSATRVFKFNFEELFLKSGANHPVTKEWLRTIDHPSLGDGVTTCMIFRVYQWGRMVATDLTPQSGDEDHTYLHVKHPTNPFNIMPFSKFFANHFGSVIE